MSYRALPMDSVKLPTGVEAVVNSANYVDASSGRQKFSICGKENIDKLYFADECELLHRPFDHERGAFIKAP